MSDDVQRSLDALPDDFRTAVVLRDMEELSYEEIGEILEVNLGTVKSRILRGREALRKELLAQESQPGLAGLKSGWAAQPAGH